MTNPITTSVAIDVPPNEVWAVMHDVERWPEWTPTMERVTRLDHGPFAIGSKARVRQPRMLPAVLSGVVSRMYGRMAQQYIQIEAERLKQPCEGAHAAGTAVDAHV